MPDATKLLELMKRAAKDVLKSEKPCNWCYGTVTSVSPLRIQVDQRLPLGVAQLVLTRTVTDHKVTVTGAERKEITIHNSLAVGDLVILLRQYGGQKYLVLDKMP